MAKIMIKCPNTGKLVYTGFNSDKSTFDSFKLPKMAVTCPHCRGMHKWEKKDAILQDDSTHKK